MQPTSQNNEIMFYERMALLACRRKQIYGLSTVGA